MTVAINPQPIPPRDDEPDNSVAVDSQFASLSDTRQRARRLQSYAVFYGKPTKEIVCTLAKYDFAIVESRHWQQSNLDQLHSDNPNCLIVAYLTIGEEDDNPNHPSDPCLGSVPYNQCDGRVEIKDDWKLGRNEEWSSSYINAGKDGWQELMLADLQVIIDKGFDGVFFDTVDTAEPGKYPDTRSGMIALIKRLREQFPDAVFVQNRGLSVADSTVSNDGQTLVDRVMFEDVTTSYSPALDGKPEVYQRQPNADLEEWEALQDQIGVPLLALDYVKPNLLPSNNMPGSDEIAREAYDFSLSYGFIPFVSVGALDQLPSYGGLQPGS